jgi:hypothetical protein
MHTNCVGVFCEIDSVTHKKGASRPIVRTEEIGTRNKLRRTFSNPRPSLTKIIFDISVVLLLLNDYPVVVGVGDVVECAGTLIT